MKYKIVDLDDTYNLKNFKFYVDISYSMRYDN